MSVVGKVLAGAAAGAAGTAVLDATTYLDMAVRGRAASSTPEQTVEAMARSLHVQIPGEGAQRDNRLTGLGALSGIATGIAVGAVYGLLGAIGLRPSPALGVPLITGGVMAATNGSMAAYGVTDPRTWSAADWASDVVPHLAYAAVLYATYEAITSH